MSHKEKQEEQIIMSLFYSPGAGSPENEHFLSNWASTWVKMTSVWLCYAIYLWTLLAPLILGNCRDFGYE